MAQNVRIRCLIEESDLSDYTKPNTKVELSDTYTPDEVEFRRAIDATTTPTTLDLSNFTTITSLVIQNKSATIEVIAEADTNTAVDGLEQNIPVGEWIKAVDIDPSADLKLTSASATAECLVFITGT